LAVAEVVAVEGFVRLSVTTTREFVDVVVVGVAVVVVVVGVVCCAAALPYENNTKPTNIASLESLLNVIIYLFYWNC
jgi:hypothetical protein